MAKTGFFHHVGTFFLFAATILLIVTCISAPVVHKLALLKVKIGDESHAVTFGTFGHCQNVDNGDDICSKSRVGYSPAYVMAAAAGTTFSDKAADSTRALTKAMILHPIACGLNFIAFLVSLGAGFVGSLLASAVALTAFVVTAVACIIDFVLFSIVRHNIHDSDTGARASYGPASWTLLVGAIFSLLGAILLFFTCCSGRRSKNRGGVGKAEFGAAPRRRRFGRW
ncbi:pali-domain-containing protein [Trichocladium antarcticum]|uniref:Pali-domain-containing protein n=1 Tax=Trichocladium antarcticum TaxID=1450529 RepID=A0AAN6UES7_9PEZI|nr:pali-domain-containing protein [Trichocladium antarcticum]